MLKLQMFSIHDSAAEAYITPFFLPNIEMAKRSFQNCVNDPNHQFHMAPADFTLFDLGEFETTSGKLILNSSPKSLGNGVSFKKPDIP